MPRLDFEARDRDGVLKKYGYLDMEAGEEEEPAKMTFYGDIVSSEAWGADREPQQIVDFLAELPENKQINLYFNSPGGDAFAGVAMYNILNRWKGKRVGYVEAIAASAATMPLMACDEIHLGTGAEIMIHDPWTWTAGNAAYLRDCADRLEKVGDHYADIYAKKAAEGVTREELRQAMTAETWIDSSNAARYFDIITDGGEAAAPAASVFYKKYKAVPQHVLDALKAQEAARMAAQSAERATAKDNQAKAADAAEERQSRAQALLCDLYLYGT